ncbi:transglutaminase-like domain-containing protein [Acinetobacter pseudolwoffii]|uniref:transglutaminase-like domain-containing protein n=1 Tax=Acinetobacter pseudolwoffii TaxID=2053287 RepID=UPI000C237F53|nr:transglutaminase family protein [Acinetobacter pseudolwoffii]MDH5820779.1 transglutaminase family protein [Acinetobacter pseudolwoffii]MDM1341333.1 transglutaminase family protein [Acinetobacter pseudolwoffii]PJI28775.1 transglutaminase family protein [Acinetobacter pseudolwoffii]
MTTYQIQCHLKYKVVQTTEFVFLIQAAHHSDQTILEQQLTFNMPVVWREFQDLNHQNRYIRLHVQPCDVFEVHYNATVERHPVINADAQHNLNEVLIPDLPDAVLPYLLASRYCNSDLFAEMANRSFGWMTPGYARVKAIEQWIYNNIFYVSGSTDQFSTATDVLIHRAGVCRDFAHLGIALCRALGIPARMVVGYVEIEKFLPDFHAIFEAYLEGGWVLFDPTRLAPVENLIRIGTGIDAGDVAFSTFYGEVELIKIEPIIRSESDENPLSKPTKITAK